MLCGKFSDWLIARGPTLELALSNQSGDNFAQDSSQLRAIMHIDAAPRRTESFAMIDGLLTQED